MNCPIKSKNKFHFFYLCLNSTVIKEYKLS